MILCCEGPPPRLRILATGSGDGSAQEVIVSGPLLLPMAKPGKPVRRHDCDNPERLPGGWFTGMRTASWISSPLSVGSEPFGMICVLSEQPGQFSKQDDEFVQSAAGLLDAALLRLQAETRRLAAMRDLNEAAVRHVLHILGRSLLHELSQPITAALAYLFSCRTALKNAVSDGGMIGRLQEKSVAEITRLHRIVGDLRESLENENINLAGENIDDIIETASSLLQDDIDRLNIQVNYLPDPQLPEVTLDRVMGLQLIFNLLRACVDALHHSVRRELMVTARHLPSGDIELCISHSGPALHGDFLDNPYVTGSVRDLRQKGFDQAICRYIIDSHRGGFRQLSMPGRGYSFKIILPLHERGDSGEPE